MGTGNRDPLRYRTGATETVELTCPLLEDMTGFLLASVQYQPGSYEPVGKFVRGLDFPYAAERVQYGPCGRNSLTQRNRGNQIAWPNNPLRFVWESPTASEIGPYAIYFRATIVRGYNLWTTFSVGPFIPEYPEVSGGVSVRRGSSRYNNYFSTFIAKILADLARNTIQKSKELVGSSKELVEKLRLK